MVFLLVKDVFEDNNYGVNCKLKCFMWLRGYEGYIYLFQLLTVFSYALCCPPFWNIILYKNPEVSHRNVGGVLLLLLN